MRPYFACLSALVLSACGGSGPVIEADSTDSFVIDHNVRVAHPLPPGTDLEIGEMAYVPGGTVRLGATDLSSWAHEVQWVSVSPFEIDLTEVTVKAYQGCVDAGACSPPADRHDHCNGGEGLDDHPVNCVNFEQAARYCSFLGKRLPTEDEWELAARGEDFRMYAWGNDAPVSRSRDVCWDRTSTRRQTCEVGSSLGDVSPYGLLDMGGNVAEWTMSPFCDGSIECSCREGRGCRDRRVRRGGAWGSHRVHDVRAARRSPMHPGTASDAVGFRCAR